MTNASSSVSNIIYTEKNESYVEINDNLEFLDDNESFIFNSEQNGYNHLYRYYWKDKQLNQLTEGKYDVESIVGIDKQKGLIYYSAGKKSALQRKLYVMDIDGNNHRCLSPEEGTHSITPCLGFQYFLDKYISILFLIFTYAMHKVRLFVRSKTIKHFKTS